MGRGVAAAERAEWSPGAGAGLGAEAGARKAAGERPRRPWVRAGGGAAMRLTQSMCTIAECAPGGDACPAAAAARPRLVKIAVVGGSGVGKTGEGGGRGVGAGRRGAAERG